MQDVKLYLGDCLDVLPTLDTGSVDAVVTDPPYGLGERWKRDWHGNNGDSPLWGGQIPGWDISVPEVCIKATMRMAKKWIVWGGYNFADLFPHNSGILVWDKVQNTNRSEGEAALTNAALGVRFFRMSRIDAYYNKAETKKSHPCEKPVALMRWCLSFLPPGGIVLDPFMGSGTTGVACVQTGRKFIGVEIDPTYFAIAQKRIAEAQQATPLFDEQWESPPLFAEAK